MAREPEAVVRLRRGLGEKLATFRQAADLTQAEVGAATSYDRSNIGHIEKGRGRAGEKFWKVADQLCQADGVLLAGFHELEAIKQDHEHRTRQAELAAARFKAAKLRSTLGQSANGNGPGMDWPSSAEAIDGLTAEILGSHTADEAIEQLARATTSIAESHTQVPARQVLKQVFRLHEQTRTLLGGKQRLSQKRELFRIEADLLAHASLLLDDLKQNKLAQKYGTTALLFASEAGSNQATARTALAKTLRWAERLIESADIARLGYESSPVAPIRVQLASQEANAAALLGNVARAREALKRAEKAAEVIPADSGTSVWSFSTGRQAIFALSVAMHTGDPDSALQAAARADAGWASGDPVVPANWAQIRVGAGIAYLSQGALEGTIAEVRPVFSLAPELRVATVTAYMDKLDQRLRQRRLQGNKAVADLRQDIRDFNATALPRDRPAETT